MSSPSKKNEKQFTQQKTVKQKFLRDQVNFMIKFKQRLNKIQTVLKQSHQIAVDIDRSQIRVQKISKQAENTKYTCFSKKQKDKIIRMAFSVKQYCSQIQNILQFQIQSIRSNQRNITIKYPNFKYSDSEQSTQITQENKYYSTVDNQTVQQAMVYDSYENHVQTLKQKLYQSEKVVGKVSDNVRKFGKPPQYGIGIKRILRKDRKIIEVYLQLKQKIMSALTKNVQLVSQAKKKSDRLRQRQEQILQKRQKFQEVSQFINNNLGYKSYRMYRSEVKRSKSQYFKKNAIQQQKFQTQMSKILNSNIKKQEAQSNKNRICINPVRTAILNQILINIKQRLKIHNQTVEIHNLRLKKGIEQRNKMNVLNILRDSHQKMMIDNANYKQYGQKTFNIQFWGIKELDIKDYRLLLELQDEILKKNYNQFMLQAKFKPPIILNARTRLSKDYPLENSVLKKLKQDKFTEKRTNSVHSKIKNFNGTKIQKESLLFSKFQHQKINKLINRDISQDMRILKIQKEPLSTEKQKIYYNKSSLPNYSFSNGSLKFKSEQTNQISVTNNLKGLKNQY